MRRYTVLLLRLAAMPLTSLADWLEEPGPYPWADSSLPASWLDEVVALTKERDDLYP